MRRFVALGLPLALSFAAPAVAAPAPDQVVTRPATVLFAEAKLAGSGVPLYVAQDARLPRVWYDVHFEAGERFVPVERSGLAALAAEVLNRGPAGIPYEQYRQELFRLGAEINWEATNRLLIAHVKSRPEHLKRVNELLVRTAAEPRLDEATFKQLKERIVNQRRALDDDMRQVVLMYGRQKLWDFAPASRAPEGWVESLSAIERAELFGYIRTRLAAPEAFITAAGPLNASQLATVTASAFGRWAQPFAAKASAFPRVAQGRRVVLIDKPGATDNQIYGMVPYALNLNSPEAAAAEVFLAGMGYGLGARLGKTLRVERGLTYHASAGLRRSEWPSFHFYSFGGNEQAPRIVAGIFELFAGAAQGLTAQEVATAKDLLLKDFANSTETPPEQMNAVAGALSNGLPPDYPFKRPQLLREVTPEQVNAQAKRMAALAPLTLVVMGDAKTLKGPLEKALPAGTVVEVKSMAAISAEGRGQ